MRNSARTGTPTPRRRGKVSREEDSNYYENDEPPRERRSSVEGQRLVTETGSRTLAVVAARLANHKVLGLLRSGEFLGGEMRRVSKDLN